MKHLYPIYSAFLAIVLTGCSPHLYTSIQTRYPANSPQSPVTVYELEQETPGKAEILGNLDITDTGVTTNCNYAKVIKIATDETNQIGGNAFKITRHILPSFWGSACHQISGLMLRLPDSSDSLMYRQPAPPILSQQVESSPQPAPSSPRSPRRARVTLHFSPGYAFVISKYIIPDNLTGNPKQGFNFDSGLDVVAHSGAGGGIRYLGYFTSGTFSGQKLYARVHYFAPEFVWRGHSHEGTWAMNIAVGFGYANYVEKTKSIATGIGGFGFHTTLGVEYRITRTIGIGAQATIYSARFKSMDNMMQQHISGDNTRAGISFISLNGGIRFHF